MRKLFVVFIVLLSIKISAQSTFRISYDVASFDLAGGMVVTPANEYVFAGTNASFIPYYGNIVKLDNTGSVLWAKAYTGGIATTFNDLKYVSTGGFIACGQSSSGGAILVRVDNNGNVIWAKRYLLPDFSGSKTSNEFFNSMIETSDGGFLAVGGVDYFWDGWSPVTVDTTSFFAIKVNSTGNLQWSRVWTISTPQPDESYFMDCAESSDGYLLVGQSADGSQTMSNGDYPSDAFFVKVNKTTGANVYINRFGNGNTTSQGINGVITLSSGHFLMGGYDDIHAFVARLQGTGTSATQLFGRRINGASFPLSQYVIQDLMENSDGNYSFIGWRIAGLFPTLNSAIIKMNSSTGAIMLGKTYAPIGLSSILPEGGIVPSDQGYFFVCTDQQVSGFNYNVIRTDNNGDIGLSVSGCTNTSVNPSTNAYNITFQAITTSTYNNATEGSFSPIVTNLSPTNNTHCLNCNITIVPSPTATPNPICAGQSATISITNTVSGYNYNVYTSSSGGTSIGSAPLSVSPVNTTTYYIEVQSQSNPSCISATRTPVTVTVNPSPNLSLNASPNPICSGSTLTLSVSGATSYTWNGPAGFVSNASNTTIANVSASNAGTYTVTGSALGCSSSSVISFTVNTTPSPTASSNSPLCTSSNLSLTATPNGMTSYSWSGPAGFSSSLQNPIINNVNTSNSGTYTLTVIAPNGCTNTTTTNVVVNNGPSVTTSASGTITCSVPTIQVVASTTTTPASYTWSGSGLVSGINSSIAVVNQAGTYTVLVSGSGCLTTATVNVSANTATPNISASASGSITCASPTIQIIGSSTTSPVSYSWSGTGIVSGANSATAIVNAAGNYTLAVTNTVNACTSYTTISVGINTVAPTVNAGSNQTLTCSSSSVNLTGSAIPSTVSVNWLGGVCGSVNSLTTAACSPGVYTLSVTNPINGCANQSTVQVFADTNVPSVSVSNTGTINCFSSTVQIIATTTSTPVSYTWSGPGIVGGNGTATITVNNSGVYSLTVTNTSNGCTSIVTNSISVDNTAPSPTLLVSNTITCSNSTATVSSISGGGTYNYTWTGAGIIAGQGTSSITVNQGGTYTLAIQDAGNGCVTNATIAVNTDTNSPNVNVSPNTQTLSCSTPTAQIVASGSASSYTWSGSGIVSGGSTATVVINNPGTYTVVGTGFNGCTAIAIATVFPDVNAPNIALSSPTETITCSNPSPTISASTGTMTNVSYSWSPSSGISSGANSSTATFTASGNYTLVVTNLSNGCSTFTSVSITTDTNAPTVATSVSNSITCTTSTAEVVAFTTNSPVSFNWSGTGIMSGLGTGTIIVNQGGVYSVTVTNTNNGCSFTTSINVPVNMNLSIGISGNTTLCNGQSTILSASGANTYTWSTGDNTPSINVTPSSSTTYSVIGSNGTCTGTAMVNVVVNNTPTVTVTPITATIQITGEVSLLANGADTYSWTPSDGLNNPFAANPVVSPTITTDYCVWGINSNGCADSACVKVIVDNRCGELFVPNVFSPNDDNNNDKLCVYGTLCIVKDYVFVIYDRWGEKVFETTDKTACWDGTYKGKPLNNATFVYYIKGTKYDDTVIEKKGNITLLK